MLPDTRRCCRLAVSGSARAGLGFVPPRTAAVSRGLGVHLRVSARGLPFAGRGAVRQRARGVFCAGNPGSVASDRTKPAPERAAMLCPSLLSHGS